MPVANGGSFTGRQVRLDTEFPHRLDKVAMAMLSGMAVKEQIVKEFGIGEDANMCIYCWKDNKVMLLLNMMSSTQKLEPMTRFERVNNALCIARAGWGVDAVTMVAEGWCSTNPEYTKDRELQVAFLDKDSPVRECLTITHLEDGSLTFLAKPYKLGVPRAVLWEEELYFPNRTMVRGQEGFYPRLFEKVLTEVGYKTPPPDEDTYYSELGDGLLKLGFTCEWF